MRKIYSSLLAALFVTLITFGVSVAPASASEPTNVSTEVTVATQTFSLQSSNGIGNF